MSTTEQAQPDTHEMVVVHRVFRREFRLLPDLVGRVGEGNTARAKELAEHAGDLLGGLHHHHHTEDELLWPPLLREARPHADLVHRMENQHQDLAALLAEINPLLPVWAADARPVDRDRLADQLRKVSLLLDEHLSEEEQEILPLVREHLTVAQWEALGKRGAEALDDKRKRLIFLGMVLEDCTPAEERDFLTRLPGIVRLLWRFVGRRQYAAYVARIRA